LFFNNASINLGTFFCEFNLSISLCQSKQDEANQSFIDIANKRLVQEVLQ
jgi:hypothetical protein